MPNSDIATASIVDETSVKAADQASKSGKQRPLFVVRAVAAMAADSPEGKVTLSALGNYLRRTDPSFSPDSYGYSGLLEMLKTYDLFQLTQEQSGIVDPKFKTPV